MKMPTAVIDMLKNINVLHSILHRLHDNKSAKPQTDLAEIESASHSASGIGNSDSDSLSSSLGAEHQLEIAADEIEEAIAEIDSAVQSSDIPEVITTVPPQNPPKNGYVNGGMEYGKKLEIQLKRPHEEVVQRAREAFNRHISKDVKFRKEQLRQLMKMIDNSETQLINALKKDFRKPSFETIITEIEFVRNDIRSALSNLNSYVHPKKAAKTIVSIMDDSFIYPEPYGVVLIIGAWNYPIQLTLCPLIGAIAAGNCVLLKPSELAPATATVLERILPKYLDRHCYHVVTGGPEETAKLLEHKFDYIFFTGSTCIGKKVHQAAAKHMTPVTLELGGKSPVYIDDSASMEMAWKRILWGKLINAGQTCVAPDYVLCTAQVQASLLKCAKKILTEFYGEDPKKSPHYPRIINDRHWQRLTNLLKTSKPFVGGDFTQRDKYIAPTIITNVQPDDPIMKEEIFGPILPIVIVNNVQEAVDIINRSEKPLALYLFTKRSKVISKILNETSSGGVCGNDSILHFTIEGLPFGGVGDSGIGAYHGKSSFDTFSHQKSVLLRNFNPLLEMAGAARYPPYSNLKLTYMKQLVRHRINMIGIPFPPGWRYFVSFGLGIGATYLYQFLDDVLFRELM